MKNQKIKFIRDTECLDGDFSRRADCTQWMSAFGTYVKSRLSTFEIRVDAYYHCGNLYLTVDSYNITSKDSIAATIVINRGCIDLGNPQDDQQDIALPGLVDGVFFIKSLLNIAQNANTLTSSTSPTPQIHPQQGLWVSLKDS
ncbi:hypothetical protein CUZ56_00233 [Saezia sanguinis]|uniref:Uncharacterized protein n=1 Tax=Saezia sanguinis TaxID=1965230 RepID=A0A433SGE6_9BURK|nr:hypothetical protein [Saezia sanguinis]RUS67756.1 hypothetical protein CUZ56_00233 [Saezia sanguinis]